MVVQMIPLPINEPVVPTEFLIERFETMANRFPEKIQVFAYLFRDPLKARQRVLTLNSPGCSVSGNDGRPALRD